MPPKVPYFNQQHGTPPAGATKRHPLAVTKIATPKGPKPTGQAYFDQQGQQLQDKGGQ
jgi:hypothetical protein